MTHGGRPIAEVTLALRREFVVHALAHRLADLEARQDLPVLAPQAAQTDDADVFAAARFDAQQQGDHLAQLPSGFAVGRRQMLAGRTVVHETPDGGPVAEIDVAFIGQSGDSAAKCEDVFRGVAATREQSVHGRPFSKPAR
jgi:hypothetical protein